MRIAISCMSLAIACLWLSPARALTPLEVLEKSDHAEYGAKDVVSECRMVLEDKNGKTSERKVRMYQKGFGKRLIRILSPADVKGIGFLDTEGKTYVYMPAFRKIRRVAGHVKNESFAGSDFTNDDLESEKFSERLKVTEMQEKAGHYILDTTNKREEDGDTYSRLKLWIRKQDFLFDRIEYYDKAGVKAKVFIRKEFKKTGKYSAAFWGEMTDLKKQHKTRMVFESIKTDTGLKDRVFSKRQLKRH